MQGAGRKKRLGFPVLLIGPFPVILNPWSPQKILLPDFDNSVYCEVGDYSNNQSVASIGSSTIEISFISPTLNST